MSRIKFFRKKLKPPKIRLGSLLKLKRTTLFAEITSIEESSVEKPPNVAHAVLPEKD